MNEVPIWVLAVDPVDPDTIFAGTRPSALFRTRDAGRSWEKLSVDLVDECPNVVVPRVTALVVDPVDHNSVWAGIEVDGVRHSSDGGDTWETVDAGITDPDIHHMAVTMGPPKTLLTITPGEVFSSTDDGVTWEALGAAPQVSLPYCRAVAVKEDDPNVVYMGSGEGAYGGVGAVHRSTDMGRTWESIPLTVKPNGTVHNFGTHPSDPSFLAASSINGQVFRQLRRGRFMVQGVQGVGYRPRPGPGSPARACPHLPSPPRGRTAILRSRAYSQAANGGKEEPCCITPRAATFR